MERREGHGVEAAGGLEDGLAALEVGDLAEDFRFCARSGIGQQGALGGRSDRSATVQTMQAGRCGVSRTDCTSDVADAVEVLDLAARPLEFHLSILSDPGDRYVNVAPQLALPTAISSVLLSEASRGRPGG